MKLKTLKFLYDNMGGFLRDGIIILDMYYLQIYNGQLYFIVYQCFRTKNVVS